MDFPIKNGDFPIKNGDFPIKNGDFPIKNGDFPYSSLIFPWNMVILTIVFYQAILGFSGLFWSKEPRIILRFRRHAGILRRSGWAKKMTRGNPDLRDLQDSLVSSCIILYIYNTYIIYIIYIYIYNISIYTLYKYVYIYILYWLVVSTPMKNMKVRLDHHPNDWEK